MRARSEIGYDPRVATEEGLAELVVHYRAAGLLGPIDRPLPRR
jgi:hypothetical protein